MNKTARKVIDYCIDHDIGTLVVGHNEAFQKDSNLGTRNNQTFVNIPYGKLRDKLEYLCELNGIILVMQEESYTSKASFWDKDVIPVYKRVMILKNTILAEREYIVDSIKQRVDKF